MGVVDVEHEVYKCPHCSGYLIIRKQFPADFSPGCSTSLIHSDKVPHYDGKFKEMKEVKKYRY